MDKSNSKIKYIPNILTVFRIILVPLIVTLILINFGPEIYKIKIPQINNNEQNLITISLNLNILLACVFFLISSFTDFLDGYIARKYKCVSDFGKFWDPIADKILVNSTLFCLAYMGYIPIWISVIILIRDIIMDGIRINAIKKDVVISANIWGKLKTIVQMIAIIFIFFFGVNVENWWYWGIQNLLNYIAVILSIISLIIYWVQYARRTKENGTEKLCS